MKVTREEIFRVFNLHKLIRKEAKKCYNKLAVNLNKGEWKSWIRKDKKKKSKHSFPFA